MNGGERGRATSRLGAYLHLAEDRGEVISPMQQEHRVRDGDDGNEYRGPKGGEDEGTSGLGEVYISEEWHRT